jgi:putative transposase
LGHAAYLHACPRFPPDAIWHAVWLYLLFTLSYPDVEDLLFERGLTVSNESIHWWFLKFGTTIAKNLHVTGLKPTVGGISTKWWFQSLDVKYIWRAVDSQGEVLEILVQPKRDKAAALCNGI